MAVDIYTAIVSGACSSVGAWLSNRLLLHKIEKLEKKLRVKAK